MPRAAFAPEGTLAGTALDPAKPLDVDMHELAGTPPLVADGLLEPDPAEPPHTLACEDRGDGRERHPDRVGDLRGAEAQATKSHDHLDPLPRGAVGDTPGRRRAIVEAALALEPVAAYPLACATLADAGSRGRRPHRPPFAHHPHRQTAAPVPTEGGVTVKPHPDLLLGAECLAAPASKEARMNQRA